jgi:peptidoglycan/LPS O-acetylase OafA/YrhL
VPLLGLFFADFVYGDIPGGPQPTSLAVLAKWPPLNWIGRHSLAIYLLHFPVVYGFAYAIKQVYFL